MSPDPFTSDLNSVDYPGIQRTSLEQRWEAAKTVIEGSLRKFKVTEMPEDPNKVDQIEDDICELHDALGLIFKSELPKEEAADERTA